MLNLKSFSYLFLTLFLSQIAFAQYALDWKDMNGESFITSPKDQKLQGPCYVFACVAALESMLEIYHNDPNININLSEKLVFSPCGAYSEVVPTTEHVLDFLMNTGTVEESCTPYQIVANEYFLEFFNDGNSYYNGDNQLVTIDCNTPICYRQYPQNTIEITSANTSYRITGYDELNLATMSDNKLRKLIHKKGPIIVEFYDKYIHPGANGVNTHHAFLLTGFDYETNTWYLKDSWPGNPGFVCIVEDNLSGYLASAEADGKAFMLTGAQKYTINADGSMVIDDYDMLCNTQFPGPKAGQCRPPRNYWQYPASPLGCSSDTDIDECLYENPATGTYIVSGPTPITVGQFVNYVCAESPNAEGYEWSTSTPSIISVAGMGTTAIVDGLAAGIGNVQVKAYNCVGESLAASAAVVVTNIGNGGFKMERDSDGDLSIENNIEIWPNPTKNSFNLQCTATENVNINIYSIHGKKVYSQKAPGNNNTINVSTSNWASGVYVIKVTSGNETTSHKLVVE